MKRIAANTFLLLTTNLSGAIFGFLIAVIIGRGLGADGLGRYSLVLAWTFGLGIFAEFGLNTLITRDAARDKSRAGEYLAASLVAKTALSLVFATSLILAAPIIAKESELIVALQLGSILIWLSALYGSFTAILRAFERMTPILILNVSGLVLQFIGTLILIEHGVIALIALAVIVQAIQLFSAFAFFRDSYIPHRVSLSLIAPMLRATLPFAFAGVVGAVETRANFVLLGALQNENAVGLYSAASRFTEAAKFLPNAFFGAAFPAFAAMGAGAEAHFHRARRALFIFSSFAALALSILAQPILAFSFGNAFADAQAALILLAWSLVPALVNGLALLYFYARGKEYFANQMLTLSIALQLVTAIPFIQTFGVSGAAISALVGDAALFVLLNTNLRFTFYTLRNSPHALRTILIPVSIFLIALILRLILIHQTQFDGLYGQDPYAYLDYSIALKSSLTHFNISPPFFWPLGYPALVALVSFFMPPAIAAQSVSAVTSALIAAATYFLAREITRNEFASALAALLVASAGQMLVSGLSAMSDAAALCAATLSASALARLNRHKNARQIALAAFGLGCAVTTRWVYALLIPVWIISVIALRGDIHGTPKDAPKQSGSQAWRLLRPFGTRNNVIIALACFFLALTPQLVLMLYHFSRGTLSNAGDLQTVSWNLTNAWQSAVTNSDGRFVYSIPIAAFYAQAFAHPSFILPLLTPFIALGAWSLRREKFYLRLLGGWIIAVWIFLAGIAWENPRFSLAFLPPLAILVGVGLQQFFTTFPRIKKFAIVFALACLAVTLTWGYRATETFAAAQHSDRAVAEWANKQLPANAIIIAFGVTQTLKHRTPFQVIEIYDESPSSLNEILKSNRPIFVLLDVANIESQWKNLSPEKNFRALQSQANLSIIATTKPYTLWAVTR